MGGGITFRNSYETDIHSRHLETSGHGAVSVAEAKVLIAKELGLEKEFARKFDLKLVDVTGGKNEELLDDSECILPGASLVVQRTLWRPIGDLKHDAQTALTEWKQGEETLETSAPAEKLPLPANFLCAYCKSLIRNPVLVRCTNGCSRSVCKACAEVLVREGTPAKCPECGERSVRNFIPNRTLALIAAKINPELYAVPPPLASAGVTAAPEQSRAVTVSESLSQTNSSCGYMIFVKAAQMSLVHSEDLLVVPQADMDICNQIATGSLPTDVIVLATGGGGTSIISPGCAKIEEAITYNVPNTTIFTLPLDCQRIRSGDQSLAEAALLKWYGLQAADELPKCSSLICKLSWPLKFSHVVLLPGKAQPIAGIRAQAPRKAAAGSTPLCSEIIKLSPAQKAAVTLRLSNEAHFAKAASAPHAGQTQSYESEPVNNGKCETAAPMPAVTETRAAATLVRETMMAPTPAVVDAMTIEEMQSKKKQERLRSQVFSFARSCVAQDSFFAQIQPQQSNTHWSLFNPLLPLTAKLPFLDQHSFQALQRLQKSALQTLVDTGDASERLLEGFGELDGRLTAARPRPARRPIPTQVQVETPHYQAELLGRPIQIAETRLNPSPSLIRASPLLYDHSPYKHQQQHQHFMPQLHEPRIIDRQGMDPRLMPPMTIRHPQEMLSRPLPFPQSFERRRDSGDRRINQPPREWYGVPVAARPRTVSPVQEGARRAYTSERSDNRSLMVPPRSNTHVPIPRADPYTPREERRRRSRSPARSVEHSYSKAPPPGRRRSITEETARSKQTAPSLHLSNKRDRPRPEATTHPKRRLSNEKPPADTTQASGWPRSKPDKNSETLRLPPEKGAEPRLRLRHPGLSRALEPGPVNRRQSRSPYVEPKAMPRSPAKRSVRMSETPLKARESETVVDAGTKRRRADPQRAAARLFSASLPAQQQESHGGAKSGPRESTKESSSSMSNRGCGREAVGPSASAEMYNARGSGASQSSTRKRPRNSLFS